MDQPPDEPATVESLKARRKTLETSLVAAQARLAANPPVDISPSTVNLPWDPSPALQKIAKTIAATTKRQFIAAYHRGTLKRVLVWGMIVLVSSPLWAPILTAFAVYSIAIWNEFNPLNIESFSELKVAPKGKNLFEDLRNIGLVLLGLIGLPLAVWRSYLALQAHGLSEKGLIIDRYQQGAQMLESKELSVRLSGIYALKELVKSDPAETYIMVLDLLFDFVRERSKGREPNFRKVTRENPDPDYGPFPPDIQKALEIASWLRKNIRNSIRLEDRETWSADLSGANLSGATLVYANLFGANLVFTNLSGAAIWETNLSRANLADANLSDAFLEEANLSDAHLSGANLSGAVLSEANFSGATLGLADLSGADLNQANLSGAQLLGTNLSGAQLKGANLSTAVLRNAILSGADLREANLFGARLDNANLSNAGLDGIETNQETRISDAWAFEDVPPRDAPTDILAALHFRKQDERLRNFWKRIEHERKQ